MNDHHSETPRVPSLQSSHTQQVAHADATSIHIEPRHDGPKQEAPRDLRWWDVSSLIVNKMVGSGIFISPAITIGYTGNRGLTLGFWVLGFGYTLMSMFLYLEFARKLRYTGGELIYLDELWKRWKWRPRLFLYTWYSFYFVLLYTTCTNALQFANQILRAADVKNLSADWSPDRRLLGTLAFLITSGVCLLIYFDSQTSRVVNAVLAIAKLVLLLSVFSAGCYYLNHKDSTSKQWTSKIANMETLPFGWAQALILVFFSFHGWENATFVAGEIPQYSILRNGFIGAVFAVGTLYIMIIAVFCAAFTSERQDDFSDFMAVFFGSSTTSKRASAVLIALSSLGSMISITYTCVRVKQIIGWVNILPYSKIWRRTDLSRKVEDLLASNDDNVAQQAIIVRRGTPEGGIILHYLVSIVHIGLSTIVNDLTTAISAQGSIMIYGHFFFEAVLGIGYAFSFDATIEDDGASSAQDEWNGGSPSSWFLHKRLGQLGLGVLAASVSVLVITIELFPHPGVGYWYLSAVGGLTGVAVLYWLICVWYPNHRPKTPAPGYGYPPQRHGLDDRHDAWRRCSECYKEAGDHRHGEDGYVDFDLMGPRALVHAVTSALEKQPQASDEDGHHLREMQRHGNIGTE